MKKTFLFLSMFFISMYSSLIIACDGSGFAITGSSYNASTGVVTVTLDITVGFGEQGASGSTDFIGIKFPDAVSISSVSPSTLTSSATDGCVSADCTTLDVTASGSTIEITTGTPGDLLNDYEELGVNGAETYTLTVEFTASSDVSGLSVFCVGMEGLDPYFSYDGQNDFLFITFPDDINPNIDPSPGVGPSNCGGGTCSYYCTYAATLPNPLPVELYSLTAKANSTNVTIDWITASEENNAYFEVYHSPNAIDYTAIGKVKGAGTSLTMKEYQFIHTNPIQGTNYYRLKQVDIDGSFEWSDVVKTTIKTKNGSTSIYPNPAQNETTLSIEHSKNENIDVEIYDINGKLVQVLSLEAAIGTSNITLPTSKLENGIYFVKTITSSGQTTNRLVVSK